MAPMARKTRVDGSGGVACNEAFDPVVDDPDIRVHDNTIVVTYYNAPNADQPTPSVPTVIRSIRALSVSQIEERKTKGVEKTKGTEGSLVVLQHTVLSRIIFPGYCLRRCELPCQE